MGLGPDKACGSVFGIYALRPLILIEEGLGRMEDLKTSLERTVVLLNRTSVFTTTMRNLELGVLELLSELDGLVRGLESAREGRFTREIMESWELERLLRDLSAVLPAGLGLVTSADRVDLGYELASIQMVATPDGLVTAVDLPLAPLGSAMDAYEVAARPVFHPASRTTVITQPEGRILLVSHDKSQFAILRDREWEACRKGSVILCPAIVPVLQATFPSCILEAFLEAPDRLDGPCEFPPLKVFAQWDGQTIRRALGELENLTDDSSLDDVGTWPAVVELQRHLRQIRWSAEEGRRRQGEKTYWMVWMIASGATAAALVGGVVIWRRKRGHPPQPEDPSLPAQATPPRVQVRYSADDSVGVEIRECSGGSAGKVS